MPQPEPDFNHNQPVYSVSEISQAIKRVLEDHFGVVRLRGEVSGWRGAHSSGHAYFSIKDQNAVINAVCWKGTLSKLAHKPEEGLEVIATGRISSYNGKYQLIVEHVEPAGAGALMALLEKRRKMFEEEGLFAPARKKKLPYMPAVIGVVTSPTGAVIRDILHRIRDRFPVHVIVWPVAVQGEGAKEQIAAAIEGFNKLPPEFSTAPPSAADDLIARNARGAMGQGSGLVPPAGGTRIPRPDVIIVARGGGSIEDLWAFNEEIVVRAVAASAIPIISAVGHETDTTLIDYVSDMRAPTPTAAAELALQVREELWLGLKQLDVRLHAASQRHLSVLQEQLFGLARGLPKPAQLLEAATQRLDDWSERLAVSLPAMLARKEQQLAVASAHLRPQALLTEVLNWEGWLADALQRATVAFSRGLKQREDKLAHANALLESLNYKKVLERGFALVKDSSGKLVTSAAKARGDLTITFKDGEIKTNAPMKVS